MHKAGVVRNQVVCYVLGYVGSDNCMHVLYHERSFYCQKPFPPVAWSVLQHIWGHMCVFVRSRMSVNCIFAAVLLADRLVWNIVVLPLGFLFPFCNCSTADWKGTLDSVFPDGWIAWLYFDWCRWIQILGHQVVTQFRSQSIHSRGYDCQGIDSDVLTCTKQQ